MSETQDADFTSLAKRCAEILDWHATGLLTGDEMRRSADFARYGDEALRQLEAKTAAEAMRFVIDNFSERHRHAEVMEEVMKVLEPFAKEAAVYDPDTGDGDDAVWATPAYFRIKHLRAARALLSRLEER